ncbi:MAG: hypothetical protein A2219_01065 [Elusimicrobia bacterium RIFOXYA2_FULL_50_26]|nr:MAG: hypothetical protein A2219_01065 [Elusimicrobia bacterium RIFOXYA2_FULL_50_26]OGS23404.1 MAG: hypothetical protein A2314_00595 [Elusimicrobia bacterium RIFOXYB2_FULL_50_12]
MKILLVDDEARNLKLLQAMLAPEGYELLTASSGEEALQLLSGQQVNMAILDVMMPGINGFELLAKIRESESLKAIPVLLITALTEKEYKLKGLRAGADDYISKPFDRDELLARVEAQMRLSWLRQQLAEKEKVARIAEVIEEGIIITGKNFAPVVVSARAGELLEIENLPDNIVTYLSEKYGKSITCTAETCSFLFERSETSKYNPLFLSVAAYPVKNPQGEVESYVFIVRDVTAQQLEGRLKTNFMSFISHKLRTPLMVMGSSFELIRSTITDPHALEMLSLAEKRHNEISSIVNRLLGFVELDNKGLAEIVSTDMIDAVISRLEARYGKNYSLEKNVPVSESRLWIIMAAEELLDNSFKFYDGGQLAVSLRLDDNVLEVSDNGPGFPAEEKDKVVDAFYQIDKYSSGQVPGLGIGLNLVKRLAELAHADIRIDTKIGAGTKVTIKLHGKKI